MILRYYAMLDNHLNITASLAKLLWAQKMILCFWTVFISTEQIKKRKLSLSYHFFFTTLVSTSSTGADISWQSHVSLLCATKYFYCRKNMSRFFSFLCFLMSISGSYNTQISWHNWEKTLEGSTPDLYMHIYSYKAVGTHSDRRSSGWFADQKFFMVAGTSLGSLFFFFFWHFPITVL